MFSSGDYMVMIAMAFTLLLILAVGGLVLCFPVARRLGAAVDEWVKLKRREASGGIPPAEITRLQRALDATRHDVERIAARQEFLESLLEAGDAAPLPGRERIGAAP